MRKGVHRVCDYTRLAVRYSCFSLLGFSLTACFNVTERALPDACAETDDDHDTAGQGCGFGVDVSEFPFSWSGNWSDYDNTFFPGPQSPCGDETGFRDVWFTVQIPTAGTLLITENTDSNVTIRVTFDCVNLECIDFAEEPEFLSIPSLDVEAELHVVVSEVGGNSVDELEMNFELLVD